MSPTKVTKKPSQAPTNGVAANVSSRADSTASNKKPPPPAKRPSTPDASKAGAPVPEAHLEPPPEAVGSKPELAGIDPRGLNSDPSKLEAKKDKTPNPVQSLALELIAANDGQSVLRHLASLEDEREAPANQAARLVQELAEHKPELLVPLIERFSRLLISKNKRVAGSSAAALPPLSRIAPAKVAKQLPLLTQNWEDTTEEGKDGLVRTFAGLCTASVAYQKRLEPALARALGEAEPKLLIRWTEIVLPALKGEPHARARAVVEERLPNNPRPQAQKIADFLGIKLRPLQR
jgi:hypothetical protein